MTRFVVLTAALVAMLALLTAVESAHAQGQAFMPDGTMSGPDDSSYPAEFVGGYPSGGWDNDIWGNCNYGCGDDCGYDCGNPWWDCCGLGDASRRWYFIADYLYVRASFSEAVAYLEQNIDDPEDSYDTFHELNFQHESSYRFGGGYQLGCCDEEVRFMYTRMTSSASAVAPIDSLVAYETISPDGPTAIYADVDTKTYDLEFRKTIPLGGPPCCGCSDACDDDPCGCGDACCAPACPAWDVTWSGGVRFADVNWNRHYVAYGDSFEPFRQSRSTLSFDGGGPRVGLEGRRYFGPQNWFSIFLQGDISVLLGQMQQQVQRIDEEDLLTTQTAHGRRIIPVTEIEAGATAQLTCHSLLSAGYLFSAWHDLGFRDEFNFATQLEDQYDDANLLGFDGFFLRLEVGY